MIINMQSVITTDQVSSPCLVSTNTHNTAEGRGTRLTHKPACKSHRSDTSILPYLTVFTQNAQKCLVQHNNNDDDIKTRRCLAFGSKNAPAVL